MGRIRSAGIKKLSLDVILKYPDKFTLDFEANKKVLNEMKLFEEKRMRNRIAGYIVTIKKRIKS